MSCTSQKKERKPAPAVNIIESLKRAVDKYPDSLMLAHDLIEQYRNKGHYDSALALTDQQIKKDSGNAYLWSIKATLYFENNDTLNAIDAMENAIAIYPLPEYLAALGTIYAQTKNRNSLHIADELLELNKNKSNKNAYFIKGLYYNLTNKPDSAIHFLDKSLQLDFSYMYAYREKAIALYYLGKYEESINVLRRAVTIQNNFDEGYYWMGKAYEKLGHDEDAILCYQNALLYDKDYIEAREALTKLQKK
ncbi:MAG: tetratricopeptide repeat protein [Ginsengibacter sp.]